MDFKQPLEYHFSQDSIDLVDFVVAQNIRPKSVLDLCSGCGVIGIDYSNKNIEVEEVNFIELQRDLFEESLEFNLGHLLMSKKINTKLIFGDFKQLKPSKEYDLILCNPPYFPLKSHRQALSEKRTLCRLFEGDFFLDLFNFIELSLANSGVAYMICKSQFIPINLIKKWSEKIQIHKINNSVDIIEIRKLI